MRGIELPLDGARYEWLLNQKIQASTTTLPIE